MKKMLLTLLIFIFLFSSIGFAIGASPATIDFENLLRSGYAERIISVSNPADAEILITGGPEGEMAEWVQLIPNSITLAPKSAGSLTIRLNPPDDIPNGVYTGSILVVGTPPPVEGEGAQVAIIGGVNILLSAEISDEQILEYEITKIGVPKTEECRPIEVLLKVVNRGNVRATGDFSFKIKSRDGLEILQTLDYRTEEMLPTKEYNFLISIPFELGQFKCIPAGEYHIDFRAELDGEEVRSDLLGLRILERGELTVLGNITNVTYPDVVYMGDLVKFDVGFENTGELTYRAQLMGEVYSGGRLIETLEGDTRDILAKDSTFMSIVYEAGTFGQYNVTLYVVDEISGKSIKDETIIIDVKIPEMYLIAGLVIILIIMGGIVFMIYKKKQETTGKKK